MANNRLTKAKCLPGEERCVNAHYCFSSITWSHVGESRGVSSAQGSDPGLEISQNYLDTVRYSQPYVENPLGHCLTFGLTTPLGISHTTGRLIQYLVQQFMVFF